MSLDHVDTISAAAVEDIAQPQKPWPAAFRALLAKRHTLMLQGPMGDFFSDLAGLLMASGQRVSKVHFNGGDQVFWHHPGALRFNRRPAELDAFLRRLIADRAIDTLVLFGQMRPIHKIARAVAAELGVEIFVFEEGYLRPNYVTIERRGVNGLSRRPRLAGFYRDLDHHPVPKAEATGQNMWRMSCIAAAFACAVSLLEPLYWRQVYHRDVNPLREGARWIRGALRKGVCAWREREQLAQLTSAAWSQRCFVVPLQVRGDSQVTDHSRFTGMEHFLDEVVASFAAHAPADAALVVKHHPMDRAYTDYHAHIAALRRRHGLGAERLRYLHDQHLPTLLQHARGVVTINSTVGLQALHHGVPTITLGESVYQVPGLVYDGSLEQFWQAPGLVDHALVKRFMAHLVAATQLNASFYAHRPALRAGRRRLEERQPPVHAPAVFEARTGLRPSA